MIKSELKLRHIFEDGALGNYHYLNSTKYFKLLLKICEEWGLGFAGVKYLQLAEMSAATSIPALTNVSSIFCSFTLTSRGAKSQVIFALCN